MLGPGNIRGEVKRSDFGYKPHKQQDLLVGWMGCARPKDSIKTFGLRLEGWTDH